MPARLVVDGKMKKRERGLALKRITAELCHQHIQNG
jgi:hypothetical protein